MFFNRKPPPLPDHKWKTVAIDSGFHTTFEDSERKLGHVITYKVCEECGKRDFSVSALDQRGGSHYGVQKQTDKWMAGTKQMHFTDEIEILDQEYLPVAGIEALIQKFKDDPHFSEMIQKHKLVKDAVGELEVALKMCKDI